ncbi:MAG TPA: hypothetical protein VKS78_04280 [Roseiarcus sp.]|nr:hypothetical protein [Roseiarcus sp.]
MTAHAIFETAAVSAAATRTAALAAAELGYTNSLQTALAAFKAGGSYAAYAAAVVAANKTHLAARDAAEQALAQSTIAALQGLQAAGDMSPL